MPNAEHPHIPADSPMGSAFYAWVRMGQNALAPFSTEALDEYESCARSILNIPAWSDDETVRAFADACASVRMASYAAVESVPPYAAPTVVADTALDPYARSGVALSRDSAHLAMAALRRDAYDLRTRPRDANIRAAELQDALADAIGHALLGRAAADVPRTY